MPRTAMISILGMTPLTLAGVAMLAGCPSDPGPKTNPATLWLAPQNSELDVQLVDAEPAPF